MRARRHLLALSLLLLSCDPTPAPAPAPGDGSSAPGAEQDGTRLRRQFYSASDGTRAAVGAFWDTKMQQPCTFQPVDGMRLGPGSTWACVPVGTPFPLRDTSPYVTATIAISP